MKKNILFACVTSAFLGIAWGGGDFALQAQQTAPGQKPAAAPTQKPAPAAAGQKPKPAAAAQPGWPKRLKDGQPDVQGYWDPLNTPACFAGLGAGCIVDPKDRQIPYQPWALARRNEVRAASMKPNPAQVDTRSRAWPDGVPRINFYHEFQIMQAPGAVVMLYEAMHEWRYIPLDGRRQPDPSIKLWMGSSRGRWEGTTLVVDVANFTDRMRMSLSGDFASEQLKVTERWNFVDANTLQYSATLTDPKVYTQPWTINYKIDRVKDPDYEIMEYAGVEGERDLKIMHDQQQEPAKQQQGQKTP